MRRLNVLWLCMLPLLHAASAGADSKMLDERVSRLEVQLQSQGLLNLLRQQEELRAEIARLRGALEEYNHAITVVEQRQKTLFQDSDARLKSLESGLKQGLEGLDKQLNQRLAEMEGRFVPKSAVKLKTADAISTPAVAASPEQEEKAYSNAHERVKKGDYPAAIKAFDAFVRDYPDSSRKGNALYWIGFSHFAQGEHDKVVTVLQRLLDELPEHAKVPDAMLTLARSKAELKDNSGARKLIDALIDRFPKSRTVTQARKLRATLD